MITKVRDAIRNHNLLQKGDRVVVAVSGGLDSVVLLHVLKKLQSELSFELLIAHVDHSLRGDESTGDAHFVEELGQKLLLPVFKGTFDVTAYAKKHRLSIEMAAREVRYAYLKQVVQKTGANKLATAHHADDQAETVLMRLLRGTAMRGLTGIPFVRQEAGYAVIRPLLNVWREEIAAFASEKEILHREDTSNASSKYLRNKIRIHLLPQLQREYNKNVKRALVQVANLAQGDEALLSELAEQAFKETVVREKQGQMRVDAKQFSGLALSLQRRVITLILYYLRGHTNHWEQIHIENLLRLLQSTSPSAEISLPDGLLAWREYESLYIGEADARRRNEAPLLESYRLSGPGRYTLTELGILLDLTLIEGVPSRPKDAWEAQFDADELSGSCIYIRTWATGDAIRPFGFHGTKLVSNLLGEARIPKAKRSSWPLFCIDDTIAWLIGVRRGSIAAVTENTKRTLVLRATALL